MFCKLKVTEAYFEYSLNSKSHQEKLTKKKKKILLRKTETPLKRIKSALHYRIPVDHANILDALWDIKKRRRREDDIIYILYTTQLYTVINHLFHHSTHTFNIYRYFHVAMYKSTYPSIRPYYRYIYIHVGQVYIQRLIFYMM